MFSTRTNWHRQPNRFTELLESRRREGSVIFDLTKSNPTHCGINYPEREILAALSHPGSLQYQPDPMGLLSSRDEIARYYRKKNLTVQTSNIFLTASTSEAYSFIFRLLCNPGDAVLAPVPSYPLFEYLAQVNDIQLQHYHLLYDHGWYIDIDSMKNAITKSTKAIVLVNPHNPTGMYLKKDAWFQIGELARQHELALIVDEVFTEYSLGDTSHNFGSTAASNDVLTFTLNGISKMCGFPQLKLGWVIVSGESAAAREAINRLEILCDTFLSVNTPVQVGLPQLLKAGEHVRQKIIARIKSNYDHVRKLMNKQSHASCLTADGGWYCTLRMPRIKSDEQWSLELLEHRGVCIYPGYFFDFEEEGYLVASLLTEEQTFCDAINHILEFSTRSNF